MFTNCNRGLFSACSSSRDSPGARRSSSTRPPASRALPGGGARTRSHDGSSHTAELEHRWCRPGTWAVRRGCRCSSGSSLGQKDRCAMRFVTKAQKWLRVASCGSDKFRAESCEGENDHGHSCPLPATGIRSWLPGRLLSHIDFDCSISWNLIYFRLFSAISWSLGFAVHDPVTTSCEGQVVLNTECRKRAALRAALQPEHERSSTVSIHDPTFLQVQCDLAE
jgi:hypothetical protein